MDKRPLKGIRAPLSGLLSIIFLRRTLRAYQWLGIFLLLLGLVCVGIAQYKTDSQSSEKLDMGYTILGISMTLIGQIFSAAQMVVEEKFVRDKNYPPLNIVGMEGLWGIVLTGGVVLPAIYFIPTTSSKVIESFKEDSLDAIVQIKNSWLLQLFILIYITSIAFFNFFGVSLTKVMTAVHRTIIDTLRTISIWMVELFIYYVLKLSDYGEDWKQWNYLQAGGFILLILGTIIYNNVITLPFFEYEGQRKTVPPETLLENKPINYDVIFE